MEGMSETRPVRRIPPILEAEIAASRIEGILAADDGLARHWRTEMAFIEAAASVGMEDIRLAEASIIMRLTANRQVEVDARGAEQARRLVGLMARPPQLARDAVAGLRRIERAAAPIGVIPDEGDLLEDLELEEIVSAALEKSATPLLAALNGAADYAHRSRRSSPAAERLIFMALDSEARRITRGGPALPEAGQGDPLLLAAEASWVVAPAASLSMGGFRIWSPISGAGALIEAMSAHLGRELGHLGTLRHDLGKLDAAAASARGRSRLADLVALVKAQPILTSARVVQDLGVTRKTALALIETLEGQGCLVNFTARRAARFWATPSLAGRLRHGRAIGHTPMSAGSEWSPADAPRPEPRGLRDRDAEAARLARIMADLDVALDGVDALLDRSSSPRGHGHVGSDPQDE